MEFLQARILEWVAIFFSRGSSWPSDGTRVSCVFCIGRQILYHCATWEAVSYVSWDQRVKLILACVIRLFFHRNFLFFSSLWKKKKIHASFVRLRMQNTFWLKIIMNQQLVLNYSKWLANVLSFTISCLENSMDRGAWQAAVHGVAESDMTEQLSTHAWLNF